MKLDMSCSYCLVIPSAMKAQSFRARRGRRTSHPALLIIIQDPCLILDRRYVQSRRRGIWQLQLLESYASQPSSYPHLADGLRPPQPVEPGDRFQSLGQAVDHSRMRLRSEASVYRSFRRCCSSAPTPSSPCPNPATPTETYVLRRLQAHFPSGLVYLSSVSPPRSNSTISIVQPSLSAPIRVLKTTLSQPPRSS